MHSVAFPYQRRHHQWIPLIPVTLAGPAGALQVEGYLDSGALMSIFDRAIPELLGLPLTHARVQRFIVGDGRFIHGHVVTMPMQIGPLRFRAPVAFSSELKVGFNLLGRRGLFEQFEEIAFQEKRRHVVLRYRHEAAPPPAV